MIRTNNVQGVESQCVPGRVLVIARDDSSGAGLCEALRQAGIERTATISDGRRALPAFREIEPDAVVLDPLVDQFDAVAIVNQISARIPAGEFMPFVVLVGPPVPMRLRSEFAESTRVFFHDAANPEALALLVRELVAVRSMGMQLSHRAARRAAVAEHLEAEVAQKMARLAELKDHPRSGHVFRVGHLSGLIGLVLGMPSDEVERLRLAAPLHDVGKVGIPDSILLKEAPLSLEELDHVKMHTTIGATILAGASSLLFQLAEEIALYHHENWDGTGYTPGLEGTAIPLAGRIVRVVDAFDAITSSRPFAERWRRDSAVEFIRSQSGQSFDPDVVEAFLEVQEEAEESAADIGQEYV